MPKADNYENYFSAISGFQNPPMACPHIPPWINSRVFRLVSSPFAYPSLPVGMFNQTQRGFIFYGCKKDFSGAFSRMKIHKGKVFSRKEFFVP
jgi:hypothetical protein